MTTEPAMTFHAPPRPLAYMLRAAAPRPRPGRELRFPDRSVVWQGYRAETTMGPQRRALLPAEASLSEPALSLLLPQITGFRLLMATVTQRRWPLPIWNALQIRNRLRLREGIEPDVAGTLATRPTGWRVVERGIEVDLRTTFVQHDRLRWESFVTFYYRGRFGAPATHGASLGAPPASPQPAAAIEQLGTWALNGDARRRFCTWTGDHNGIHRWDWYARRFGFARAFAHPQFAVLQCLARLQPAAQERELDLWIKGPVGYGCEVELRRERSATGNGQTFWLHVGADPRPALVGRLAGLTAGV